jgi:formate-dependent nitrite reductase membrane component NrfD
MEQITWGILLAAYLFVGGMAGGSYIIGALADIFGKKEDCKVLSKSGVYVSLIAIIMGLLFLILDLGRFKVDPLSPLNAYSHFPTSIMSVGTWIITAFMGISLITAILWFFKGNGLVRKLVEIVGIVLGFSTAAYTGLLLSFARATPFWGSPFLPWLFIISGVLTGFAMALFVIPIIAVFMPRFFEEFKALLFERSGFSKMLGETERYLAILTIIEIVLVILFVGTTPGGSFLMSGGGLSIWFFAYIILGLLAPLGIGYFVSKMDYEMNNTPIVLFSLGSFILTLGGGLVLRYVILIAGQIIH